MTILNNALRFMPEDNKQGTNMKNLKVTSAPGALVQNLAALSSNTPRYIGRTFDASEGPHGGWKLSDTPEEVPFCAEYLQAVREGDLIPADKSTAEMCGVKFKAPSSASKS